MVAAIPIPINSIGMRLPPEVAGNKVGDKAIQMGINIIIYAITY